MTPALPEPLVVRLCIKNAKPKRYNCTFQSLPYYVVVPVMLAFASWIIPSPFAPDPFRSRRRVVDTIEFEWKLVPTFTTTVVCR